MEDKEPIYDERISPLMKQIIDICKENGIPMVASFRLNDGTEENDFEPLKCTSFYLPDGVEDEALDNARRVLYNGWIASPPFMTMTITSKPQA